MKNFNLPILIALCSGALVYLNAQPAAAPTTNPAAHVDVTVGEGTSMAVSVSPDGSTLAIDLQGSIWTLPAAGGTAKRITTIFNDARHEVTGEMRSAACDFLQGATSQTPRSDLYSVDVAPS